MDTSKIVETLVAPDAPSEQRHRHRRRRHADDGREEGAAKDGDDQSKHKHRRKHRTDTESTLKRLASGALPEDKQVTICVLNGSQLLQTSTLPPSH